MLGYLLDLVSLLSNVVAFLHTWWCCWSRIVTLFLKKDLLLSQITRNRSSCSQTFVKVGVLKNVANFTGKHLCWNIFLIKLQALSPATLLKRHSNTDVFCKICDTFKNTSSLVVPFVENEVRRYCAAWKVSVFGAFLLRIFPHSVLKVH